MLELVGKTSEFLPEIGVLLCKVLQPLQLGVIGLGTSHEFRNDMERRSSHLSRAPSRSGSKGLLRSGAHKQLLVRVYCDSCLISRALRISMMIPALMGEGVVLG